MRLKNITVNKFMIHPGKNWVEASCGCRQYGRDICLKLSFKGGQRITRAKMQTITMIAIMFL